MHIPSSQTDLIEIVDFYDALSEADSTRLDEYDHSKWLYVPNSYGEYRYILGTKGLNPLICVGINPSTAAPDDLDNTLKSVERIATANGYDSFIMFNVYAQRATDPDHMDDNLNDRLHEQNMEAFRYILSLYGEGHTPSIWAAWGTIITKRSYLCDCVKDMIQAGQKVGARWLSAGKISKAGHPHHPLYLKKDEKTTDFDIEGYLKLISI